jgi:nitrile hydratase
MSPPSDNRRAERELEARVNALESLLVEKSLVDRAALQAILDLYETKIGPRNGAHVVAHAWVNPDFKRWLLESPDAAIASLGYTGRQGEHVVVVENTPDVHHLVVCTLCSCYPWPLLGLPPSWYKSAPYRSRAVIDPKGVLADFGVRLPAQTRIQVWDSNAEVRYLVLPMRPAGTEAWSESELAALVSRNAMIGTDVVRLPAGGGRGAT